MSEEITPLDGPTLEQKTPTVKQSRQKATPRKNKNSPTEKQVQARGHIKQSELLKWTVFVSPETKIAVQKAAKKAGVSDTVWIGRTFWEAATGELTTKPQPPAKVEDVADLMGQLEKRLADQQAQILSEQGKQIEQLTKAIDSRPSNLKEWFFGKSDKGQKVD